MLLSGLLTFSLESVRQAWEFALKSGAGIGLVLMLRWYWWRVSAVSEIAALVAAALGFPRRQALHDHRVSRDAPLHRPLDHGVLACRHRADPGGADGAPSRFLQKGPPRRTGMATCAGSCRCTQPRTNGRMDAGLAAGCGLVYGGLFGTGSLLFGSAGATAGWFMLSAVCGTWLYRDLTRPGFRR